MLTPGTRSHFSPGTSSTSPPAGAGPAGPNPKLSATKSPTHLYCRPRLPRPREAPTPMRSTGRAGEGDGVNGDSNALRKEKGG